MHILVSLVIDGASLDRPQKTLRGRYLLALALTAIVAIVQFGILFDEIYAQQHKSRIVDLAAGQRTLAVEIASLASAFVDASTDERPDIRINLTNDVARLASGEANLTSSHTAGMPRDWPPARVRAIFARGDYDVSNRTDDFVRHATRLLATPENSLTRRDEDLIYLSNVGPDLAYRYGIVVAEYLDESDAQRLALLTHEALGLAALLLTLALELPLLFAPLEAKLGEQVRALVAEAHKRSGAQRIAQLGTWERDFESGTLDWSDELCRIAMLGENENPPHTFADFDHPDDAIALGETLAAARAAMRPYCIDHRILTRTGETRWVQESAEFIHAADGSIARELGTAFDITERKRAEAELFRQANHDALTGLPNRRLLRERVTAELRAANESKTSVALLYADLDRFKMVNDSLGHATGDELLVATAARLHACVREGDIVARTGGDEFVVVLTALNDEREAARIATAIVESCAHTYVIGEREFYAPLSVGYATAPHDVDGVDALMRAADRAMYEAKDDGGGRAVSFAEMRQRPGLDRFALETQLRAAIEREELHVAYQPVVTPDGRTVALEALVRWNHPDHGPIGPDRFVPIAEETGLIAALDQFVLKRASGFVRSLQRGPYASLRLAVNVSSREFKSRAYVSSVRDILKSTGFDPALLELEITESTVMHDVEQAIATMHALKAIDIRIAIDDFGTGFSSLAYLRRFPIDTLKIDRAFIGELSSNARDGAIVGSIITLARALRLGVVAEGIETLEQAELLAALHCEYLQGYYFSRPLPEADVAAWLDAAADEAPLQIPLQIAG